MLAKATRAAALLMLLCAAGAQAAPDPPASFAWPTRPGAQVKLDAVLSDEAGHPIPLWQLFFGAPVILNFGYFHCPSVCGVARTNLLKALAESGLVAGRDYVLVAVSLDPAETPADAASAKAVDLAQSRSATGADWHYLTGAGEAVGNIADAIGFHSRYDPQFGQSLHPTGLAVLTSTGTVSGYLLGAGYPPGDLRAAVLRASGGGIALAALPVLLLCFHFDSTTGHYTLAIERLLRLMGGLSIVTLGGVLIVLHRQRPGPVR